MTQRHSANPPPVTVGVINYNGRKIIEKTLRSIYNIDYPDVEVIMVDDCSTDDSVAFVKESFPDVVVYEQPRNMGLNAGRNRVLKEAGRDITLLSDNDMELEVDCLRLLAQTMLDDPEAAVATPMILDASDRRKIYSDNIKLHYLCAAIIHNRHKPIPANLDWTARRMVVGSGGMLLVRKSLISRTGGFDEDYRFGYDEGEFALRVSMSGLKVMYVPSAKIYHHESPARPSHRLRYAIANRWRLMLTAYSARTLVLIAPSFLLYEVAQFGFLLLKGATGEWFRAVGMIAGDFKKIMEKRRACLSIKVEPDNKLLTSGEIFVFSYRLGGGVMVSLKYIMEKLLNGYWLIVRPWLTK